jgi:hypothetical protein
MSQTDFDWKMEDIRVSNEYIKKRKPYLRMMLASVIMFAVTALAVLFGDWATTGPGRLILGLSWGQLVIAVIVLLRYDIKAINERHRLSNERLDRIKNG